MQDRFELHMDKIEWNGSYRYGQQTYNISLDIHVDTNGVFGVDKDNEGVFVIRGTYNNQNHEMLFTRAYIGGNIQYFKGSMTNNGQHWVVRGEWQFAGGAGGQFEIYRPAPADQQFQQMQQQMNMHWQPPPPMPQAPAPQMFVQPGYIR